MVRRTLYPLGGFTEADRALLLELRDELRALRADLVRRRTNHPDPEQEAALLSVLAERIGARAFTAAEAIAHAAVDRTWGAALEGAGLADARSLGAGLRRLRDRALGGYVLRAIGREAPGVLWRVYADSHAGASAGASAPVGCSAEVHDGTTWRFDSAG